MNIYLSGFTHLNSVYTHESGQILYKVVTPFVLGSWTSTIFKAILPDNGEPPRFEKFGIVEPGEDEMARCDADLKDKLEAYAKVDHNLFSSSVLRFDGQAIETSSYFRKEGFGPYGRHRVFTGPDGREYKWYLGWWAPYLCLHDEACTPVANFYRRSFGILTKKHPPYLEILPAGLKIIDTIVMTFVYIEKIRQDGENSSRSNCT